MKNFVPLLFLASFGLAHAGTVDCGTPVFVNGEYVGYDEKVEFPNPPKAVSYSAWELKKPATFCSVLFTPKNGTLTVTSLKLEYFGYMTTPGRQSNNAIIGTIIKRPTGTEGIKVTVNFDPYYTTSKVDVYVPADLTKTSVVAARIDGGKLQPLYWPGVGYSTVTFPKAAKVVEVYLKTPQPANWQRMVFNLKAERPTLTLYRKYAFPAK